MSGNYWFEYEGTLFLSLNSNYSDCASHVAFMKEAQEEFLKLHGTPVWQIVTFHHSIFSCGKHASSSSILELREGLANSLSELNIDVVLMGHDHVYTRSVMMQGTVPTTHSHISAGFTPLSSVTDPKEGEVLYLTLNSASGSKYNSVEAENYNYIAVQNQESVPNMSKITVSDSSLTVTTYEQEVVIPLMIL
ncbi:MAG: metallophosphoesterase family protein [Eubacteriales bacterium]